MKPNSKIAAQVARERARWLRREKVKQTKEAK